MERKPTYLPTYLPTFVDVFLIRQKTIGSVGASVWCLNTAKRAIQLSLSGVRYDLLS